MLQIVTAATLTKPAHGSVERPRGQDGVIHPNPAAYANPQPCGSTCRRVFVGGRVTPVMHSIERDGHMDREGGEGESGQDQCERGVGLSLATGGRTVVLGKEVRRQ